MEELKIVYLPVDALKPYEHNARRHAEEDIATIKNSIKQFQFSDPIGIWGPENLIVEGHGRLIAAKELGMKEVPVIRLDHLTDEQRRAYALAHNKTAEMSGWDFEALEAELADLEMDFDMAEFGFDDDEKPGGDDEPPVNTDSSFSYKEQYAVAVMCADEADQQKVYERLTADGYDCRVVCV